MSDAFGAGFARRHSSSAFVIASWLFPRVPVSRVRSAVVALDGVEEVQVDFTAMTPDELAALRQELHGDPAATAGSRRNGRAT